MATMMAGWAYRSKDCAICGNLPSSITFLGSFDPIGSHTVCGCGACVQLKPHSQAIMEP